MIYLLCPKVQCKLTYLKDLNSNNLNVKKGDDHLQMARHQKWGSPTVFKLQTPNSHQMNLLTHEKSPWGQIFKFLPLKVILAPF